MTIIAEREVIAPDVLTKLYLNLTETREECVRARLTRKATLGWLFKTHAAGSNLTNFDVLSAAERIVATEQITGSFYLSPSGTHVLALRPATVKGVKMLKCVASIPVGDVVGFDLVK